MPVFDFPGETFTVEGDPAAVRESGRSYSRFATVAADAASGVRSLDSGSWVGSEGELYRSRVAEIPPPLDVAHGAFGEVAAALGGFADDLEAAQRRMAGVRAEAESIHFRLVSASGARDGLKEPDDAAKEADPEAQGRYEEARSAADARVGGLQSEWSDQLGVAASIGSRIREAASRAAKRVREAGRRSPTAGQNWFSDHWEKAGNWIDEHGAALRGWLAEHAGVLRVIADVMRIVGIALVIIGAALAALSFIAGFFSFGIGWLGEVPAGALIVAGFALWGLGDALDTAVDWGEGKIDGNGLMLGLAWSLGTAVVGGALLKLGGKALAKLAERFGPAIRRQIEEWFGRVTRRSDKDPATGQPYGPRTEPPDAHGYRFDPDSPRTKELEWDPAVKRAKPEEARVGQALEHRGDLPGPIVRDQSGDAEFIDAEGRAWDIKAFNDQYPGRRGHFTVEDSMRSVAKELGAKNSVILDTRSLTPANVAALRAALEAAGQLDQVLWYP